MNEGIAYTLSNASMDVYPKNTRAQYTNTTSKTLTLIDVDGKSLWVCLEAVTIENSIVQYKRTNDADIITLSETLPVSSNILSPNEFFMPEKYLKILRLSYIFFGSRF